MSQNLPAIEEQEPTQTQDARRWFVRPNGEHSSNIDYLERGDHFSFSTVTDVAAELNRLTELATKQAPPSAKSADASGSPKSQGRCETTMTERFDVGGCDCPTFELGPCAEFEAGSNGRCVYCDHGEACHAKVSAALSATTQAEGGQEKSLEEPRAAIEPRSREGQMELRVKVAELCGHKCLGAAENWQWPSVAEREDGTPYEIPDYPNDLNACHELILYLRDRGFWCEIKITIHGAVVCFRINDKGIGYKYEGTDKQLPVAICRAFVAAMEGTKP